MYLPRQAKQSATDTPWRFLSDSLGENECNPRNRSDDRLPRWLSGNGPPAATAVAVGPTATIAGRADGGCGLHDRRKRRRFLALLGGLRLSCGMLNAIWIAMVLGAIVCGALTGSLDAVAKASTDAAGGAVSLAIGLVGVMALWLGLMRVLHEGGMLALIARALRPIMTRLFPGVPADSPAMSMMILNMTANMLGLGNAATPFGLKAMMELDRYNDNKGTATDAMALFLAINTSALAIFPSGMIAARAGLGANNPGSIVLPTWIATACSTVVAIIAAKFLCRLPAFRRSPSPPPPAPATTASDDNGAATAASQPSDDTLQEAQAQLQITTPPMSPKRLALTGLVSLGVAGALTWALSTAVTNSPKPLGEALMEVASNWILVALIAAIVLFGFARGVKVYDAVITGGKEGFDVALRIIPYLVAILVAVGMLRAAGAIDLLVGWLDPITGLIGMPAEALPMAFLRPLSGTGAYAVAADIMGTHGADSLVGNIVSTMQGSTETTFYVLALYFGVVAVKNGRHTLIACLLADTVGVLASVWACNLILS